MHDIKGNKLQINSIESREQVIIAIGNLLRYAVGLVPASNYDLVPKWYVDNQLSGSVNETTVELTVAELEATYPDVRNGYPVMCELITDNPILYIKTPTTWRSIPLGSVAP